MENCERCGNKTTFFMMSFFNTQVCCEECIEKEKAHANYDLARSVETEQVKMGNYNFSGIGLPSDLK